MGRNKGSRNKIDMDAQAKAKELGIDPFEVLLLFAAGDWKKLGYDSDRAPSSYSEHGTIYKWTIDPAVRGKCAEYACGYLLSKRKAVEHSLSEIPDPVFDQEVERRVHLKILNGEIKASDVG